MLPPSSRCLADGQDFWPLLGHKPLDLRPPPPLLSKASPGPALVSQIITYGRHYFGDAMNVLDFVLVIIILVNFLAQFLESTGAVSDASEWGSILDAIKTIRVFRLLRLFQLLPLGIRSAAMSNAFLTCVPKYIILEVIHFIFIWLFTVIGCNLFYSLSQEADTSQGVGQVLGRDSAGAALASLCEASKDSRVGATPGKAGI